MSSPTPVTHPTAVPTSQPPTTSARAFLAGLLADVAATIPALVTDADGRVLEANPAACALLGARRYRLVARPLAEVLPEAATLPRAAHVRVRRPVRGADGARVPLVLEAARLDVLDDRLTLTTLQPAGRPATELADLLALALVHLDLLLRRDRLPLDLSAPLATTPPAIGQAAERLLLLEDSRPLQS